MPKPSTWASSVEPLTSYSHSTQAVDLRLCYTVALVNLVRAPRPSVKRLLHAAGVRRTPPTR
jgi:hypothetical protein